MEREALYEFYKELELKDYVGILIRRKRIVLIVLAVFVTLIRLINATPIYRATAQILIEREY